MRMDSADVAIIAQSDLSGETCLSMDWVEGGLIGTGFKNGPAAGELWEKVA